MPVDEDRARAALRTFIAELNTAREAVGPPSYGELETLSQQFSASGQAPGLRVRVLAASTTHDILTGQRRQLPQWGWVASFVAVLRVAALHGGLDPDRVGTIGQWRDRYEAARTVLHENDPSRQPQPQPADGVTPAEESPQQPAPHRAAPAEATEPPSAPWDEHRTEPSDGSSVSPAAEEPGETVPAADLTTQRCRYLDAYGRTGMRLLRNAESGDGEAAYRLAALLICDDRPNEALYWLQRAKNTGHLKAAEMYGDPYQAVQYWRGVDIAYQIGLQYAEASLPHSAAVFFERAGDNGHPDAAYRAGLHFERIGKKRKATAFFIRAARNGHPNAHRHLPADELVPFPPPSTFPWRSFEAPTGEWSSGPPAAEFTTSEVPVPFGYAAPAGLHPLPQVIDPFDPNTTQPLNMHLYLADSPEPAE